MLIEMKCFPSERRLWMKINLHLCVSAGLCAYKDIPQGSKRNRVDTLAHLTSQMHAHNQRDQNN